MRIIPTRAAVAIAMTLCIVGANRPANAGWNCDAIWAPYLELEGHSSEIVLGDREMRGGPQSIPCDRGLEMSGSVTCTSPWLGLDPNADLIWRATDMIFEEEFVFGSTFARRFRGGPFEIVDPYFPQSPVLVGYLEDPMLTWNPNVLSGSFVAWIIFTGGSAPQVPGQHWNLSIGANLEYDGDPTGWGTLLNCAIYGPILLQSHPLSQAPTSWGQIKGLYR